ncbi:hypothetical protein XA68_11460 [Ophiocordyceps unilateralis]|uniref:Uncharacterized protein n=1 Tax=Ophiocordyceps unilateralis TaxID=268505 RepID=A0A2A9PF37_OPHUN|nr:hypothetical protein XA68_11460 [Ophiocordyceps unilateralis]
MKLLALFVASSIPSTLALVQHDWSFDTAPAGGFDDISFPINMVNAPHARGFYFAQQFSFEGVKNVAYTGLQPQADAKGKPIIHALFSTFQGGSTTSDKNCHQGADGGAGVSCAIEIPASYEDTYHLKVQHVQGTTWRGYLINKSGRGAEMKIGEWTLPQGAGKLQSSQIGFVEYFPWNSKPSHKCGDLPRTEVTFGYPLSSSDVSGGKIKEPYENGDCVGKVAFSDKGMKRTWRVNVGF